MTDRSDRGVPRGDHVPGGPNDASAAELNQKARPGTEPASHRSHGAHDKGADGRAQHDDPSSTTPPFANGSDRGGDSARDGSRVGRSVVDQRSE
jgi:hypothetical protein